MHTHTHTPRDKHTLHKHTCTHLHNGNNFISNAKVYTLYSDKLYFINHMIIQRKNGYTVQYMYKKPNPKVSDTV